MELGCERRANLGYCILRVQPCRNERSSFFRSVCFNCQKYDAPIFLVSTTIFVFCL